MSNTAILPVSARSTVDNDHPLVTDGEYRIVMPSSSDKTKTVSEVRLYDEIIVSGQNLKMESFCS